MQKDQMILGGFIVVLLILLGGGYWLFSRDNASEQRLSSQIQEVEQTIKTEFEEMQNEIMNDESNEDLMIEEGDEQSEKKSMDAGQDVMSQKGGDIDKESFVFIEGEEEWNDKEFDVIKLHANGDKEVMGSLQSVNYGDAKAQLVGSSLYFLNRTGGVSVMDLTTKTFSTVDIQGVEFENEYANNTNVVRDFLVTGDTIFYLIGACAEIQPCALYMAHTSGLDPILLKDDFDYPGVGGVFINESENVDGIEIEISWGDAGTANRKLFDFNLADKTMTQFAEYHTQYCGENNEYCDEEDIKRNAEYEAYQVNNQPTQAQCGGQTIEIADEKYGNFVGCI